MPKIRVKNRKYDCIILEENVKHQIYKSGTTYYNGIICYVPVLNRIIVGVYWPWIDCIDAYLAAQDNLLFPGDE